MEHVDQPSGPAQSGLKFSIVIPHKQRLETLRVVFASLAEQTLGREEFEVVVGAMEYSPEYVTLCREFSDRIAVVSVLTAEEWNVSRARNLAIRHASGQVLLLLDADMALPANGLRDLYDRYFAHGQNICVTGQAIGYHDVVESDVADAEVLSWDRYRDAMAAMEASGQVHGDVRWTPEYAPAIARFPWAFVGTGLVALPLSVVRRHDLLLDEGFRGWGPEDQEWAFRISRTGTPIVQATRFFAVHLPHPRDVAANGATAWANNRYYLAKWPRLDLELALAFGWLEADRRYPEVERELAAAAGAGRSLATCRGTADGRDILLVGATVDTATGAPEPEVAALFDAHRPVRTYPLAGFGLPYPDASVEECRLLPPVGRLSPPYREAIRREAERAARKVVAAADDDRR
ncbi:glycosyltransferase [Micromonospora fluostatini]|uniref:Glycosyltransferase n=1 Tax=Micromonospora fluostatini TaxID=1629071 RepID=A0ABY2DIU7_9ACTN|nr:glycosyltransferase [Micromonospora fluostatini]